METVDHNRALATGRGAGDAKEEGEDESSEGEEEEGEGAADLHTQAPDQPTKRKRKKSKKKLERERTLPIIVQWLQDTYEEKEGKTVGRYQVYDDYIEFCARAGHLPTNNAALGKIFKRVFPNVGWRRLGKRGESKMHYANIRKRKGKVEQAALQASSFLSSSSSSSLLTLTSGSGGIKAEPDEREHGYESKARAVARIKEDNDEFGDDEDDDSDGDDNEYSDTGSSSNNNGGGDREKGRGSIMELERELELGGVEGGDAFIELLGESAVAARHDRFAGFGGGDGSVFGGAVPMAQHRTKFPGRERERRWRRRDHLTTSREEMEEPRGLFFSSGVPSPSSSPSSSSFQGSAMMAAPPGNLSIWNADAHLDLMMAVRYYRDRFRKISWSLIPINPMSLKMRLLNYLFCTEEGQLERSSLSLSACVMISIASFGAGHFDVAEEFFHKAREHLSYVFDSSDYDVASALVPLAWLTTFFSPTPEEGRNRQIYFCTIGTKICEQVGALNDETHWALLSTLHVKSMESASDAITKTRAYPPYQKQWKNTRLQRGRISGTYDQTGDIFGSVFALSVPLIRGFSLPPEEERRIKHGLMVQLGRLREAEQGLVHAQDQQVRDMMAAYYFAMRTFINVLLENSRQIETARELVRTLMLADRPIMAVVLHELSSNKFLLIRTAVQVLVRYKEYKAIKLLMEAIYPFTSRFPWMHAIYVLTQQAVQESFHGLRIASCSPPLPLPAQAQSLSSSAASYPPLSALVSASAVPPPPAFYLPSDSSPLHSAPHHQHPHSHPHQPQPPHYQPRPHPPQPQPHLHAYGHHTPEPMQRASPSPQLPDRRPSSASYSYIFYADPSSSLSSSAAASATDPAYFPLSSSSSASTSPTVAPTAPFQSATGSASYPTISPELSPFPSSSSRATATFRPITSDQPGTTHPSGSPSLARALDDMSLLESLLSSSPSSSSPSGSSLSFSATSSTSTSMLAAASYEPPPLLAQPWEQEMHLYHPQGPPPHAHTGGGGQPAVPQLDPAVPRHGSA
ncbi:RFX DNA-binding domain containing protein [Acanthamoeba castellanii str. Neff]|uniref:RFX DNA-binding domain containing protein n=1 Tax=Acanthamoeba castellanii (strain ATCC 30010 / Neff) TaxID=1257118 RepID=L8H6F5_ACACF|nr:RFX DNA-binding domain containing protein [Acanthamoeba castellanii str. Neff]ELR20822.1 RFX DNA-binding domain containing protein [Acanthamoeba castellanii str. Neff]